MREDAVTEEGANASMAAVANFESWAQMSANPAFVIIPHPLCDWGSTTFEASRKHRADVLDISSDDSVHGSTPLSVCVAILLVLGQHEQGIGLQLFCLDDLAQLVQAERRIPFVGQTSQRSTAVALDDLLMNRLLESGSVGRK